MDKLNYKFKNTKDAFQSLELAIRYYSTELTKLSLADDLELRKIIRDSVVQRFEYTVELCWKLIFAYIESKHLIEDSAVSPKTTLRIALKVKLLSEDETCQALNMINDRNLTSHTYKEEVANELIKRIPSHIKLMKTILKRIEEEL